MSDTAQQAKREAYTDRWRAALHDAGWRPVVWPWVIGPKCGPSVCARPVGHRACRAIVRFGGDRMHVRVTVEPGRDWPERLAAALAAKVNDITVAERRIMRGGRLVASMVAP